MTVFPHLLLKISLINMNCGEKATLVEKFNGIGQLFGTKSIAEATALIREGLRRTYVAQLGSRTHELKIKEPHGVESNDKKESMSDMFYERTKTECNEEETFNSEVCDNASLLQPCPMDEGGESGILKNTFKSEVSTMSEREGDLDMTCEPENILNSEEQVLSNEVFAQEHCPTQNNSRTPPLDCSLYDTPVRVTGIFQNTSVSKGQTSSHTDDENTQVSADIYNRKLSYASDTEMSFTAVSGEIEEKNSQPSKKALKETIIKEIVNGSIENIEDISREDVLSPELISALPSKQSCHQSSFSEEEILPQHFSCRKKLSYTMRKPKFSDLANHRKEHSKKTRKNRFSAYKRLPWLNNEQEVSSEETSLSSSDESSSDLDWCETLKGQHHISRCGTSIRTREKCGITLEEETENSPSFLVEKENHISTDGNSMHAPGIEFSLDALSSDMYQPSVFVVDCCKVKRSLKQMLECRICLRGLQCNGFV